MRLRLIAAGAVVSALALATVALAQQRGGARSHPAAAAPAPPSAPPPPSASTSAAATTPSEAGALPSPPASSAVANGSKLSPLNPAPNELAEAGMPVAPVDYDRLLAELASLRARAAAVSDVLFHSRLAITLETSGEHARIASLAVAIDDGNVWSSPASFRAEEAATVYDHSLAPGRHAVTVDVERHDERDDTFRSSQKSRFVVDVPSDGRLSLDVRVEDDSSMGGDFRNHQKGKYDLRIIAEAKSRPLAQGR
jgi:hypothetical protein